jgi:GTPase SAR1 family protein
MPTYEVHVAVRSINEFGKPSGSETYTVETVDTRGADEAKRLIEARYAGAAGVRIQRINLVR